MNTNEAIDLINKNVEWNGDGESDLLRGRVDLSGIRNEIAKQKFSNHYSKREETVDYCLFVSV